MAAWESMDDAAYDRAESYGQATYYGHPEPCDDAFWLGVNRRADAIERATTAALEAVDRVIALLPSSPSVEGDPLAARPVADNGGLEQPSPSASSWPVHQPAAPLAPIPGRHWFSGCDPDRPRVRPDGTCEGCGERACPECGREGCDECVAA